MVSLLSVLINWPVFSTRDADSVVDKFKVCVSSRWLDGCPKHLDVCAIVIDEGAEDVEVLSSGVEPDDDCSIFYAKCDDDGAGEIAAACWEGGGVGYGNGVTNNSGDVDRNWEMSSSRYGSPITHMAMGCHV